MSSRAALLAIDAVVSVMMVDVVFMVEIPRCI